MPEKTDLTLSQVVSVALVGPNATRRKAITAALAEGQISIALEIQSYPLHGDLPELARLDTFQVALVDLDGEVEEALRVIEDICDHNGSITVMAVSVGNDTAVMRRAMEAGAREFLVQPFSRDAVRDAFARTAARRRYRKKDAKVLVFLPTKGGVGTTTIASNFALALTKESGAKVVIVDLDFQLGEVALGMGLTATFSVADALQDPARLDRDFLSTLLVKHSSGLSVLAAAEKYSYFHSTGEGAGKLFRILEQEFDYVVVDAGSCHSHIQETLFAIANTVYVVTELTFPALRNAHRLVSFIGTAPERQVIEMVLNRFNSRTGEIDESNAVKAIGRPIKWKIPNAFAMARAAQDSGIPLVLQDSPITHVLKQMAKNACGKPFNLESESRSLFAFFGHRASPKPAGH
jgi:pilus assembly protein CpaE